MRTMRFATVLLLALPFAMPSATAAQTDQMRFRGMDRNNDGVITRDEWRGSATSFQGHDWNGDGVLSGDEVRVGAVKTDRTFDIPDFDVTPGPLTTWNETSFLQIDRTRDGRITANEWYYDREGFVRADRDRNGVLTRAEFLPASDWDDDRADRFDDMDGNRDGRIDRNEWHGTTATFYQLDRNRDNVITRAEALGATPVRQPDRFVDMDTDRDGRITANEWPWSRRSFTTQDLNGDGGITRREFTAAASPAGTPVATSGTEVTIDPRQRWTATGVTVRAGDMITFEATGRLRLSSDPNDEASPGGAARQAPDALLQANAGAVIARVDNSAPFLVGDRRTVRAPAGGEIFLGVNDDFLGDNSGTFRVTITVR